MTLFQFESVGFFLSLCRILAWNGLRNLNPDCYIEKKIKSKSKEVNKWKRNFISFDKDDLSLPMKDSIHPTNEYLSPPAEAYLYFHELRHHTSVNEK